MERNLHDMDTIQTEKAKEIRDDGLIPLDPEGIALAEHKRYTIDIIDAPADPLR